MSNQETQLWQSGVTDAPLPPMANPQDMHGAAHLFLELYKKLGPIYRLPNPGKPLTVLAGPEANVFTARYGDEFFTSRELWEDFNQAMGGIGGMATNRDGEANRQRRLKTSRSYVRTKVLDQLPRMVEITQEYAQWQPGQSFEVVPTMQRIVAEQLGQLMVRHSMGDYLEDFVFYLNTSIATSFGLNSSKQRDILSSPEFLHAKERAYELGRVILEEHRATPPPNGELDIVDEALAEAAQHPELYSEEKLAHAGLGPLLAGLETVAKTSSFLFYALLTNPPALKRVVAEIDQAFAQGPLSWETLKSMHAVQGAAMETLRMYTVAGGYMAVVAKPFSYAGYRLEPSDTVYVAMTVPHFLPELFPHPETFDIDRFQNPRNEHRQRGVYAPFGLGEHTCLGAGIAEIQLMVIAATLLHDYEFALDPPDYQLSVRGEATPAPEQFRIKVIGKR